MTITAIGEKSAMNLMLFLLIVVAINTNVIIIASLKKIKTVPLFDK
jgi:hypothetical protein